MRRTRSAVSKTEVTHPKQANVETRGPSGSPKTSGTERSTGGASGGAGASVDIAGGDRVVSLAPDPAPSATSAAPGTALDQAQGLSIQAEQAAKRGDYVTAYERALSGWQKVNPHAPADPDCISLLAMERGLTPAPPRSTVRSGLPESADHLWPHLLCGSSSNSGTSLRSRKE